MIVESHAHLSHFRFDGRVRCALPDGEGYTVKELDRQELFEKMAEQGIAFSIEPAIDLASNEKVLDLHRRYPDRVFCAVGVHPTRTFKEKWRARRALEGYLSSPGVVAVGETGLDFHMKGKKHRLCQTAWFLYQIRLAKKHRLPLILHVRQADDLALFLLRLFASGRLSGVVHCFSGTLRQAKGYLALGFHLGIGGALLKEGSALAETVKELPLERLLTETDSPYVLPEKEVYFQGKRVKEPRNTPLLLPRIVERIAEIKGVSVSEAEQVTCENARRLFDIPEKGE